MKKLLILLFALTSSTAFSQSKKLWLYYADEYFKKANYISALDYYQKTLDDTSVFKTMVLPYEATIVNQKLPDTEVQVDSSKKVPLYDYIMHQIAMCYRNTFDYHHAIEYFKITSDKGAYPEDLYNYAKSLMNAKRYEEAIENFEKYITSDTRDEFFVKSAQRSMTGCYYAMDSTNVKTEQYVNLADTNIFNKGTSSFAPMFWGNNKKLIFASARVGGVLIDPEKQQSEYLCDLYWTEMEDSVWGPAHNFGRPVNTAMHEAAGTFTADDMMYFTRWSDAKRNEQYIYLARMMNGKWFEALKLDSAVNYPGYKSVHPFVSLDGTTLYYSSNRPGGKGGMDLWTCQLDEFGNPVGKPVNMGEPINTPYDEVTPFFHTISSTLYFSSNGHPTTGGLDVFKSAYNIDEELYAIPVNVGMPINSSKDDAYLIWDRFLKKGYFSSDREDCPTGHCYDIYEITNGPITISIEGFVYDAATDEIIPNALVTFKDVKGEIDPFFITTDESGFYSSPLTREQELFLKAQKVKYLADAASVNTFGITESTVITQDFFLKTIPVGDVEIPGIEYDYDKATLRAKSKEILDKLYDFLALNDNLVVEINSHTDCRGNDAYNMKLSQQRAQSCVDYLILKGIDRARLIPKGYGETTPIPGHECATVEALKETDHDKFEEMHQKNRRTAFRVIKQDDPSNPGN
ncbi:MAG: OmpA family protein [Flavobacteriales bacterium]